MTPISMPRQFIYGCLFMILSAHLLPASSLDGNREGWLVNNGRIALFREGHILFEGRLDSPGVVHQEKMESRPVEAIHLGYSHGPAKSQDWPTTGEAETLWIELRPETGKSEIALTGIVAASGDSWACDGEDGPGMVRGAAGNVWNGLNRAVFDRAGDWTLSVHEAAQWNVEFLGDGRFEIKASGPKVSLALRPKYIRNHRGFVHWTPGNPIWPKPICGWCSWAAYWDKVTENDMIAAADFLTTALLPYGYSVVQMDDGYQRLYQKAPDYETLNPGETVAGLWSRPNDKFPHGLAWLAKEIAQRGFVPGIWVGCYLPKGIEGGGYVAGADGKPYRGNWVNYSVDGFNKKAVDAAFLQTICALKKQGWNYFKIDTIRHVIYDAYRKAPGYWKSRGEDPDLAFRALLDQIKKEIGPDIFMLACWGVIPEMAGIPDGCRIGEDVGPSWASAAKSGGFAAQFNYLNRVVWRNDPDYMCLRAPLTLAQARSWVTFLALTGSQLMISDRPEHYDHERLEILHKVAPPLDVHPAVLRPLSPAPELWTLDLADAGGSPCTLAGRIAWNAKGLPARTLQMREIGLNPKDFYLLWDFWNEKFLGVARGEFQCEALAEGDCRVYCIRRAAHHPQVLSTNRHIGQGAIELSDVAWTPNRLSGRMSAPPGRPWSLFIHVPQGYTIGEMAPAGAQYKMESPILRLTLQNDAAGIVMWSVNFNKNPD